VKKMKTVLIVLIAVIALAGVVLVAKGYPDWNYQILPGEGAVFQIIGQVDANITNAQINVNITNTLLDVNVTNSTITIEPATDTVFEIKPSAGVTFNIQGSVDANITNSELDVKVTNSTLNVTVQGTADVEIQNAELNVQTLREQASAAGKVATATWSSTSLSGDEGSDSGRLYTNSESSTVYVEMITHTFHALSGATSYGPAYQVTIKYVFRHSDGSSFAVIYSNPYQVLNFDPAIPLAPGDYVEASVVNRTGVAGYFHASIIVRKS